MTDALLSFAVNKIGDYLARRASLFLGVEDQVRILQEKLRLLEAFVQDAEVRELHKENNAVRENVSLIRNIVYDAEDIFDTYIHLVQNSRNGGCLAYLKNCFCMCDKHDIATDIQSLNLRISHLGQLQNLIPVREDAWAGSSASAKLWKTNSMKEKEPVLGLEDQESFLLDKLLNGDPLLTMISIYGPGGLGKTTFAKKLYHSPQISGAFNERAWICVSQDSRSAKELLRCIIKSFWHSLDASWVNQLEEEDLERYLHHNLSGKKYLLVVDDVWDKNVWERLSRAFPDDNNGSRVMMTTRDKNVAEVVGCRCYPRRLRSLSREKSWELFCSKAFQYSGGAAEQGKLSEEERQMAEDMVGRCRGLPLAIAVLGSLLSRKEKSEWKGVQKYMWKHVQNAKPDDISNLLALSFAQLRRELKLCFLCLSVFPEDYVYETEWTIGLFVVEGFIPRDVDDRRMEEMAEEYLIELADRNLIEAEIKESGNLSEWFRIHDLLRDLVKTKAKEMEFHFRRQVFCSGIEEALESQNSNPKTRSIIYVGNWFESCFNEGKLWAMIEERFKLLRVLYIVDITPKESSAGGGGRVIGVLEHLVHLRCLALRVEGGRTYDFNKLVNLEYLLVSWLQFIGETVIDISSLQLLRYVLVRSGRIMLPSDLKYLHTLRGIKYSDWCKVYTQRCFQQLRILEITGCEETDCSFHYFNELEALLELKVDVKSFNSDSLVQLGHCPRLKTLDLEGKLKAFPKDVLLSNLEFLMLNRTYLEEDPLPVIAKFPRLKYLMFGYDSGFYCEKAEFCIANTFPLLEELEILDWSMKSIYVEEEAVPKLRKILVHKGIEVEGSEKIMEMIERVKYIGVELENE